MAQHNSGDAVSGTAPTARAVTYLAAVLFNRRRALQSEHCSVIPDGVRYEAH
jgi:hypothetical protein